MRVTDLRCKACIEGKCSSCLDVARAFLGLDRICPCLRKGHTGEPHGAPDHVCSDVCKMVNS